MGLGGLFKNATKAVLAPVSGAVFGKKTGQEMPGQYQATDTRAIGAQLAGMDPSQMFAKTQGQGAMETALSGMQKGLGGYTDPQSQAISGRFLSRFLFFQFSGRE